MVFALHILSCMNSMFNVSKWRAEYENWTAYLKLVGKEKKKKKTQNENILRGSFGKK